MKQHRVNREAGYPPRDRVVLVITLAMIFVMAPLVLDARQPEPSFSRLLQQQMEQAFQQVCQYIDQHPAANDLDSAYQWIFQTALDHDLESRAVQYSEQYLQREQPVKSVRQRAQQVLVLGQAKRGRMEAAWERFQRYLKEQPAYTAEQNIDFAIQFASEAQLQKRYRVAADIYGQTARRFNLNPRIRELCENKLAKLRLINEAAPPIAALDVSGRRVDLASYRGKVLLIDFWATNCPPCLEALPQVTKLYEKYHPRGFDILGISLDIRPETVNTFRRSRNIPWQLMMLEASKGSLRQPYKVRAIPSLYLVNKQGKIVQFDLHGKDLERAIVALLEKEN